MGRKSVIELVRPATEQETLLLGVLLNSFWAMMFVDPKGLQEGQQKK